MTEKEYIAKAAKEYLNVFNGELSAYQMIEIKLAYYAGAFASAVGIQRQLDQLDLSFPVRMAEATKEIALRLNEERKNLKP